jgi:O-antigen ligase
VSRSRRAALALAVVLVVATACAVDPEGLRPFTTLRWAVVGVAAAGAAASVAWRVPRRLRWLWFALLACLAVATVVALDPLLAAVGHPRRHLGLAGWVVGFLAFAAGTGLAADPRARRVVGWAAVVAGLVTGVATVADLAGWDPAGVSFAGGRVGGLLGQPVYLGAAAVLLGPAAAGVACDLAAYTPHMRRIRRQIALAWVGAGGFGLALVASGTRGAWLGAVAAGVVAWPQLRRRRRVGGRRVLAGVAVAAAVALVVVGPVGTRVAAAVDPGEAGGRSRLDEWALAAAVVADHPLTGVGPEGYRIAAPAHVDDTYARRHGRDEVVDRAHSGPLDVAAAAGIPAAVVYVALLATVVAACVRAVRRPPDSLVAGMAAGVVAWVVQQAVSFPLAEVDPAAWLLAGMVAATGAVAAPGPAPVGRARAGRIVAGLAAGVLAVGGVVSVVADRDLQRATRTGDGAAADRATALRPDDVDAWYVAAQVAASGPSLLALDAGLDRVEEGLDRLPRDPALGGLHEALLTERALRSGLPEDLAAAEAAARDGIARDPAGPAHHRRLGVVLAARGDDRAAAAALRRVLDLDPGDAAARTALDGL